ncbi:hypothetical protein B7463_g2925, partial [Scytalidium lignicola]
MGGWNNQSDRDLLLAIIAEGSLKSIDWEAVAKRMGSQGYTFTKEGCRQPEITETLYLLFLLQSIQSFSASQLKCNELTYSSQHFMKIKKESAARSPSAKNALRKPRTPSKGTKGNAKDAMYDKNQGSNSFGDLDDDEEDLMEDSPSKKRKMKMELKEEEDEWRGGSEKHMLFKVEDSRKENGYIDLVNEDLYEA